MMTHDLITML